MSKLQQAYAKLDADAQIDLLSIAESLAKPRVSDELAESRRIIESIKRIDEATPEPEPPSTSVGFEEAASIVDSTLCIISLFDQPGAEHHTATLINGLTPQVAIMRYEFETLVKKFRSSRLAHEELKMEFAEYRQQHPEVAL